MQAPRFVTQPSASASIVSEGRAKFLQCQAVGECHTAGILWSILCSILCGILCGVSEFSIDSASRSRLRTIPTAE